MTHKCNQFTLISKLIKSLRIIYKTIQYIHIKKPHLNNKRNAVYQKSHPITEMPSPGRHRAVAVAPTIGAPRGVGPGSAS